jgi:aminocarboxymuconate-semialdehyde decarboxylase
MRIDVHAHLVPPGLPNFAAASDERWPSLVVEGDRGRILVGTRVYREIDDRYWSVARRRALLDAWGIDMQVLSPLPVLLPSWATGAEAAAWCHGVNEAMAEAVAAGGPRFRGLGILPVQDHDAAIAELAHIGALGLVGVELGTAVDDGRTIGDPSVDALHARLAADDVPVLVHPTRRVVVGDLAGVLQASVGVTIDTTLALLPRLWPPGGAAAPRACVAHGGGTLPWVWPRLRGLGRQPAAALPPWFHVDTAALDCHQLDYVVRSIGANRLLFGTDCPATPDELVEDQLAVLQQLGDVGVAVLAGNARRFYDLNGS